MKLVVFGHFRVGVLAADGVRDVSAAVPGHEARWPYTFMLRLLEDLDSQRPRLEAEARRVSPIPLDQVRLRPPIPLPGKIIAAASNYHLHHQEMGGQSEQGEVFLKAPSSVIGSGEVIQLPNVPGRQTHYETELAAVVGRTARNLDESNAMECLVGYTMLLDITVRGQGDRSRRKSYDTFTPLGPCLVTADEIPDPHSLGIKLWRNGELCQNGNSRDLVYKIPQILRYASSVMTLRPGDVITTGTPDGVGPIADGDKLRAEIEQIGAMSFEVRGPAPGTRPSTPDG